MSLGIDLLQFLGPEAQPLHYARGKILNKDVRFPDQLAQQALATRALEVERDRLFVGVEHREG